MANPSTGVPQTYAISPQTPKPTQTYAISHLRHSDEVNLGCAHFTFFFFIGAVKGWDVLIF